MGVYYFCPMKTRTSFNNEPDHKHNHNLREEEEGLL